jgi:hypothetical protein
LDDLSASEETHMNLLRWLSKITTTRSKKGERPRISGRVRRRRVGSDELGAVPKSAIYPFKPGIGLDDP